MKVSLPVVGGLSVTVCIILGRLPDVPISVRVVLGFAGLLEPLVLVTGVVDDQIQHQLHSSIVELVLQDINVIDISVRGPNFRIITDIIPLYDEICLSEMIPLMGPIIHC